MTTQQQIHFVQLVRTMRQKQTRYYTSSTQGRLKEMQAAEKLVDDLLATMPVEVVKGNGGLF